MTYVVDGVSEVVVKSVSVTVVTSSGATEVSVVNDVTVESGSLVFVVFVTGMVFVVVVRVCPTCGGHGYGLCGADLIACRSESIFRILFQPRRKLRLSSLHFKLHFWGCSKFGDYDCASHSRSVAVE